MHNFTRCFTRIPKQVIPVLLFSLFIASAIYTQAQQPAFPGAEGAGMYTTGGRGTASIPTTVFEVTNLNDDNNPGSLRYALTASAIYRTIVFRVSGTIHLNSKLTIRDNTTIAGQTAPGDGICVADHPTVISGNNVIVRYMRFRMGDKNQKKTDASGNPVDGSGGDDAFGGLGVSNIIMDHCSVSWSSDECLTIYRGDNLTIQWSFVTEPLNYSYHYESPDTDYQQHGYGGIWGAKRGSMHHNLIAHCRNRNPRFAGISTYTPNTVGVENVDFRNNVIYNWGINTVYGGEGGNYNVVNNYYKWGPNTSSGSRYRICNPSYSSTVPFGKWYVNGNYVDGSTTNTNNNWSGVLMGSNVAADTVQAKVNTPFDLGYPVTTQSATDAFESVLQNAGAILPRRDTLDQRIVNDVRNRTGRIIDVQGGYPHGTDYSLTVNAWPTLNSTTPPADTDHDGMPDSWETSHGLNPNDASDRNTYDASGYTMLENYLNGVVNTDPAIAVGGSLKNFSQSSSTPSATQTYTVSGYNLTGNVTVTPPASYELSLDGTTWYGSANPIVLTPAAGTLSSTTIMVRLNASAEGTYAGQITHASTGAATVNVSVTGQYSTVSNGLGIVDVDGGFENQTVGAYTTVTSHTSTTKWEASAAFSIADANARTGSKYFHFNQNSSSNKYIFTPVLTTTPLTASTSYVVQFWYRTPSTADSTTTLSGWATLTGATGGSGSVGTNTTATIDPATPAGTWTFFSGTLTTNSSSPTNTYAGIKVSKPWTPHFDIDDYVIYAGTAVDATAPDAPASPTGSGNVNNNTITVNWVAPSTGVDGGGYVVVRSTSAIAPVPNANGVYIAGNEMGAGYKVVYLGTNTSFTDTDATLSADTRYYYYIFTADKAYNYSATAASVNVKIDESATPSPTITASGSLVTFKQTQGSPSSEQTFTVSGTNLTNDITITPVVNYELSADNGATWTPSAVTLTPANGTVSATSVLVRLNAATIGAHSGNIVVSSTGATSVNVPVNGNTYPVMSEPPSGTNAVVAIDGSGDYTSVQAAINAAPTGRTTPWIIYIRNGRYKEKVSIPSNKPFIYLIGESVANTIIVWDDYSGKVVNGVTIGTSTSATVTISAADCYVANITMENATGYNGDGPQALAINVSSDRCIFKNCRFIGGQDTVLANGDGKRQYFRNCYIDGNTDFIFGSSIAVFDSCVIFPRDRVDGSSGGYVTAANTPSGQNYGYVFRDCKITKNRGVTSYTLGRPWQNDAGTTDKKHNKVVFLNTIMASSIRPEGWSVWNSGTNTSLITYAEYKSRNWDGTLLDVSKRVSWSKQLTDAEAAAYYNNANLFGTWDPCALITDLCTGKAADIAVSNFRAKKGTSTIPSLISWNLSWPVNGVTYQLFRSSDNVTFTKINEQTINNDSTVSVNYSEAIPPPGETWYYYVTASKDGLAPHSTDTILVSSTPTITTTGTLGNFIQGVGTPSNVQAYSVSGVNLTQGITITPPAAYEISLDNGANWSASAVTLPQSGGTVPNTTISVRLNATAAGNYTGNITHASTGAETVNVVVNGNTQSDPLPPPPVVLQHWPMAVNNQDDAAVRSAAVTASTPVFSNLYLSNGTQVPAIKEYSAQYGQAFGASSNGDGSWVPSPGGSLNRVYYEQFTVTAASGYKVRIDSVLLTTAFISTSNGKMAVVYSKSGFVSDSANVTGGTGPGGALISTANGGFTTPIAPANQGSGPTNTYALALNNETGILLNAGETVTLRIYYAAGSTSPGRYAMLKDVRIKGLPIVPATVTTTGTLNNFTQIQGTPSAVQTYMVSGSGLTGDVTITPPAGYEVSANSGTTWFTNASPLVLTPVGGTVPDTTISVRLNAAAEGAYAGNITHESAGAATKNMAVTGTTSAAPVPEPVITVGNIMQSFSHTVGKPSDAQTINVSVTNVPGTITITPPAGYEISVDTGKTWYTSASAVKLLPAIGSSILVDMMVRLNAGSAGTYDGNIVIQTGTANAVNVAVTGTAYGAYAIHPNPARDFITIYHAKLYTVASFKIYNANGYLMGIYRSKANTGSTTLYIGGLPNGMYFVEFTRLNERVMLKFIKQ